MDALACQKEFAQKIVDGGGDYCLSVKANQMNLHADISNHVADQMKDNFSHRKANRHEKDDKGHGRVEKRSYYVLPIPKN